MGAWVRAASLSGYLETAAAAGLDARGLLARHGLTPAALADPDRRLPAETVMSLLEQSAAAAGLETFGLAMAERRRLADFGAVGLLLAHQRTARSALMTLQHYQHLMNPALSLTIEEVEDTVTIREDYAVRLGVPTRQAIELSVGVLFRMYRDLFAPRWAPLAVHFAHDPPKSLTHHRRVFSCPIEFGSDFSGVVCSADALDEPNPAANVELARYAQRYLDGLPGRSPSDTADLVRQAILHLVSTGPISIDRVALYLGLSVRTLQRRLDHDHASFSALLDEVRRSLATRYLANRSYSVAQVADLLGYSAVSPFTRWFTTQFGVPPTRWRASE